MKNVSYTSYFTQISKKYLTNGISKLRSLAGVVADSLRNSERDYTSEPLKKAIILLSIPMVLEMVMESIFAVVDIFFVSRLGSEAVAAVGITESLMTIIYSIAFGLAVSTTAMVSRRIGEKNKREASKAAMQAIITGHFISILIAIPGIIWFKEILEMMGASPEITELHSGYTMIMFSGNIIVMTLFIINAIFRSAGDPSISMKVLWVANTLNLILDPLLIFGLGPVPALGVTGAAIATNTGRGIAILYQLYLLFGNKSRIMPELRDLIPDFKIIGRLLRLSIGSIGQYIIATSSWIGLVRIISVFGSDILAGYTIAIRIIIFALLPSWGMSNATATLVGQNLGAEKPERAERAVWMISKYNLVVLGSMAVILIAFSGFWMKLFIAEPSVIEFGAKCLEIISYGFLAYGVGMVVVNSFNGAGDTMTPTIVNIICFWAIEIPLAYSLSISLNFGETGVFIAIVTSETLMTILSFLIFRRGRWKLKQV